MSKLIRIWIAIMLLPFCAEAADFSMLWKKGTEFYLQKQYDSAAICFSEIAKTEPQNAELYYNLGNCYYRLNRIAPAVLNYERALFINPDFAEAKDNLSITQARMPSIITPVKDIFFIQWWKGITSHTMSGFWAWFSVALFISFLGMLWLRRSGYTRFIPGQMPIITMSVCVLTILFGLVASGKRRDIAKAVVIENESPLMNDGQKGKPLLMLAEGTSIEVISTEGLWAEVKLPDGREGWILQSQIEPLWRVHKS